MTDTIHYIALKQQFTDKLGIEIHAVNREQFSKELALIINHMIMNDMNRLMYILYRVDVAEEKVLKIIQENSIQNAAQLIAEALISRQIQKIKNRSNTSSSHDIPEDEKW